MYVLQHFDWFGSIEELEEVEKKLKKHWDGKDGIEFLGRYSPTNKRFHWTHFYKVKDWQAWANQKPLPGYKRDYNVVHHAIYEFYE